MDNKILLDKLAQLPALKLNKHVKSEKINGECITRNKKSRRKNVIGDINPNGSSFILYHDGKWVSKNRLGLQTVEETITWVKRDIERLSR